MNEESKESKHSYNEESEYSYRMVKKTKIFTYTVYVKINNGNTLRDVASDFKNIEAASKYLHDLLIKYKDTPGAKCYLVKQALTDVVYEAII